MLSAAESTPVLPHNENIPVYRLLTAEENKRSGKVRPVGGEEFRKSKGRIYVSVIFRGKRICNSFGTSAQSYARARRWQVFFRNLKLRERVFWLYSPHIRHYPDRFVVVGYRRDQNWGKRRTRKTCGSRRKRWPKRGNAPAPCFMNFHVTIQLGTKTPL